MCYCTQFSPKSALLFILTSPCRCNVDPKSRNNCGPPGVTAEQCENAGCCFSSEVPGVPWCFTPLAKKYKKVCPAEVKLRRNCGYPGIPANVCEARGCCFESKPPAVPWCFFPLLVEEGKLCVWSKVNFLRA
uniref:Trefoil factor 2 n=1 Tax=Chelydra serpentina TaxID=8475 RepID=A0A8C3T652_CHESE